MLPNYLTVKGQGNNEIIIEKSRFIAHVSRTETEEEALGFIAKIKKIHKDATHNCSAYMIGEQNQIQKALDDGEPTGTAGVPILEVIKKRNLKDTTVVVTRYFGGIKLGAGGLIRAYSKAASEGITATGVVQRKLVKVITVEVEYPLLGKLENELRSSEFQLKEIIYLDKVTINVFVEEQSIPRYKDWMVELTSGQAKITEGEQLYLEEDFF
ncbi:YigZ family protein [Bacillus massiliglaciei]|uniref:YigZ family protein n=1 Tax=Bacillus massiliglaciei TaxID=1816693 RepID=UPI000B2EE489|nr:YigZ family protein [Bacillus massiliglaciei]